MHVRLGLSALLTIATLALVPASASAATSLGGFWHLDEAAGTTAADDSNNANHGTITGAPTRITGRFGRSLRFDGIDDNVVVPRASSLEPEAVTVETWLRAPASPGQYKHIISQGATGCGTASWGLYSGVNNGLQFYIASADAFGSWAISPDAGQSLWDNEWHHVAGTFDGATVRLFVDGAEVGSGTPTDLDIVYPFNLADTYFGVFGGCNLLNYQGDLDEPRVWGRAMSNTEIAASVAMGGASTTTLDEFTDSSQSVAYTKSFSNGNVTISTESATGTELISFVRLRGIAPALSLATCRNDLLALLNSICDITLSNGGRTATLKVRRILLSPTVTLRVHLNSGRTFDVTAQTP